MLTPLNFHSVTSDAFWNSSIVISGCTNVGSGTGMGNSGSVSARSSFAHGLVAAKLTRKQRAEIGL